MRSRAVGLGLGCLAWYSGVCAGFRVSGLVFGCLGWWSGVWVGGRVSGLVVRCLGWVSGVWVGGWGLDWCSGAWTGGWELGLANEGTCTCGRGLGLVVGYGHILEKVVIHLESKTVNLVLGLGIICK